MNIKKLMVALTIILILFFGTKTIYIKFFKPEPQLPYKTILIKKRDIYQTIDATGTLEIKDSMKIGSLIGGTLKKMYVKVNDKVKKGQLLALIDNGKGDTDVLRAQGELKNIQAQLNYQENYYLRQRELFNANQISKDFFEQVIRNVEQLKGNLITARATLRKAQIDFDNTKILAPDDGMIIAIGISEGERVTTDLDATILFKIAKDLTKMEAILNIDESDIGQIAENQKVQFNVSTYPDKEFKGSITDVSYTPINLHGILNYKASVDVDNKNMMLRPGMTINAEIKVAKSKNTIAIPTQAFQISSKLIKATAKQLKYKIEPVCKKIIKTLAAECNKKEAVKMVWTISGNKFIEKPIIIGITDDNFYEVKKGIKENEEIIVDVEESDKLKKIYAKIFKSAV